MSPKQKKNSNFNAPPPKKNQLIYIFFDSSILRSYHCLWTLVWNGWKSGDVSKWHFVSFLRSPFTLATSFLSRWGFWGDADRGWKPKTTCCLVFFFSESSKGWRWKMVHKLERSEVEGFEHWEILKVFFSFEAHETVGFRFSFVSSFIESFGRSSAAWADSIWLLNAATVLYKSNLVAA